MIIQEYNPEWPIWFDKFYTLYYECLNGLILGIEHVGSTAIPNLPAKPIIDIDLVIKDYSIFPLVIEKLNQLGYTYEGDLGIRAREVFKRENESVPYSSDIKFWIDHHLYVCLVNSEEFKRHIKFRNKLRDNSTLRNEYAKLKYSIISLCNDNHDVYVEMKAEMGKLFFEKVLH